MNKTLNFQISLSNFELFKFLDEDLALMRVMIVDDNPNAHELNINYDAILDASPTLIGKAFVAKYNEYKRDAEGHEPDEVPFGYFPTQEFEFVENENGSHSLYAYAVIFKSYCEDIYKLFTNKIENGESPVKSVSMEIRVLEETENYENNEVSTTINKFAFKGVTLLGESHRPAIPLANSELVQFSKKIKEIDMKYFEDKSIKINNSKESATNWNGSWSNPRKKTIYTIAKI